MPAPAPAPIQGANGFVVLWYNDGNGWKVFLLVQNKLVNRKYRLMFPGGMADKFEYLYERNPKNAAWRAAVREFQEESGPPLTQFASIPHPKKNGNPPMPVIWNPKNNTGYFEIIAHTEPKADIAKSKKSKGGNTEARSGNLHEPNDMLVMAMKGSLMMRGSVAAAVLSLQRKEMWPVTTYALYLVPRMATAVATSETKAAGKSQQQWGGLHISLTTFALSKRHEDLKTFLPLESHGTSLVGVAQFAGTMLSSMKWRLDSSMVRSGKCGSQNCVKLKSSELNQLLAVLRSANVARVAKDDELHVSVGSANADIIMSQLARTDTTWSLCIAKRQKWKKEDRVVALKPYVNW